MTDIALAVILHPTDDSVLIARRMPDAHLPDVWEFPGGKCEPGESTRDAAVREALEEVGVAVTPIEEWPAITHVYTDRIVTLHPWLCRAASANAQALGSQEVRWVNRDALEDYEFPPANRPLLDRIRDRS